MCVIVTLRGKGKLQSWSESIRSEYETGFSELMSLEFFFRICTAMFAKVAKKAVLKPDGGDGWLLRRAEGRWKGFQQKDKMELKLLFWQNNFSFLLGFSFLPKSESWWSWKGYQKYIEVFLLKKKFARILIHQGHKSQASKPRIGHTFREADTYIDSDKGANRSNLRHAGKKWQLVGTSREERRSFDQVLQICSSPIHI